MASKLTPPEFAERDGTSQVGRALLPLQPDYVQVDEHTPQDALAFARAYGKELTYYGPDGTASGDWSGLVGPGVSTDDVLAFLAAPDKFSAQTHPELFRPHFVLFLAFVQLMDKARADLNTLTARHLDFYYRQFLRLVAKPSIPDHVNLVVDLVADGTQVLLPAGSQLDAGPDSQGRPRIYATDTDLVVSRAQLAGTSSLFVDCRRTQLHQVPALYKNDTERACEALFKIALGDPLPLYPDNTPVNYAKLQTLHTMLQQAQPTYGLSLADLRDLMARVARRPPPPAEWATINAKLQQAGNARLGGNSFQIDPSSRDFAGNWTKAVGTLDKLGTLPQVTTIDDLYDLRGRSDVVAFFQTYLPFFSLNDFAVMMQAKRKFETEWREINLILTRAGQSKTGNPAYALTPTDVADFATNVKAAMGVDASALQSYWNGVTALETYFYLAAEQFLMAMDEILGTSEDLWSQVFSILEDAHKEKLRHDRRAELQKLHQTVGSTRLVDLIRFVLGEDPDQADDPSAQDRLAPYLDQADINLLAQLAASGTWDRIYSLLEVAERNRLGEPPAQTVRWMNLYPATDATAVPSPSAPADQGDSPRWPPFGAAQPATAPSPTPAPVLGFALSSPLLMLSEGPRVITLTLGFAASQTPLGSVFPATGDLPILFQLSTAKGWVTCTASPPIVGMYNALAAVSGKADSPAVQFVLTLGPELDPIVAPPAGVADVAGIWPVLRLMMRPLWSADDKQYLARYPDLAQLQLLAAHVRVSATGLTVLSLQNEEASFDSKQPFTPFGSQPAVGSRLLIGHPEAAAKNLDSLTLNLQWMGAPDNLSTYYANYGFQSGPNFTARVSLVDRYGETLLADKAALFGATGSTPLSLSATTALTAARPVGPDLLASGPLPADVVTWDRYFRLELNSPDFQHANYPNVATAKALSLALATAKGTAGTDPSVYQVSPPYTPKLKSLTMGYSSSLELRFDDPNRDTSRDRAYHVHPFGACDVEAERMSTGLPLLPRYSNDGELYLQLRDLSPPQAVSLFFQVAEGSANPDLAPQTVSWSYLSGDRFLPLDRNVLSDTTRGLSNSGIVQLALDPADPSTRVRGGLYVVRATVTQDTTSVCDVVAINTQGVAATFIDQNNAPDHFSEPLPASTLSKLVTPIPEIAGIRQPFTSYGGRPAEDSGLFTTRASERLRHKQRALALWDYERLALDRFPELHKVKCIPAAASGPGKVVAVVIPDVRNKLPFEPFAPKAPANVLAEVQTYLQTLAPAFATVIVQNARYVAVRVRLGVRFSGVGNEEFYKQKLNDELNRFLSPWAYDEGADIAIGGRIYASTIVDFVDRRPYVDYVAGIKLFSSTDGENFLPVIRPVVDDGEGYYVGTTQPDQVLVAARAHQFDVLSDDLYQEKLVTGIGFMKLELDFIVADG